MKRFPGLVHCSGLVLFFISCSDDHEATAETPRLDQAQIARELAEEDGFSTKMIRPSGIVLYPDSDQTVFDRVDSILRFLRTDPPSEDTFSLSISHNLFFQGSKDDSGAGMALVLDRLLELEYSPDGVDQMEGFEIHRYKK